MLIRVGKKNNEYAICLSFKVKPPTKYNIKTKGSVSAAVRNNGANNEPGPHS